MRDVVLAGSVRTAIGKFGGSLRHTPPPALAATVIKEALRRAGVPPERVEDVVVGCVGQVAENAYVARTAAVQAGIPPSANAFTVNRLCSSGLQAIITAAQAVRSGDIDVAVAAGVENMSQLPFYLRHARWGEMRLGHGEVEDGVITMLSDPFGHGHMGVTAEAVAEKYGISREEQDAYALESQRRAAKAIAEGEFRSQIVGVEVPHPGRGKGSTVFDTDEYPRPDTTLEKLASLKPVFREGGTVTAGNASGINDGAAAVVVMAAEVAEQLGVQPEARLVASAMAGIEPLYMGYAPALAIPRVLDRVGLDLSQMDVIELNEAFAAQVLAVMRDAGLDPARTNPNGGAIALGHPVGATACILVVKALHYLRARGGRYGMVTMCVGGGQGLAAVFENLSPVTPSP